MSTIESLGVGIHLDTAEFTKGAKAMKQELRELKDATKAAGKASGEAAEGMPEFGAGLTGLVTPMLAVIGGALGAKKALSAYSNSNLAGAKGFNTTMTATGESLKKLSEAAGEWLAPGVARVAQALGWVAEKLTPVIRHFTAWQNRAIDFLLKLVMNFGKAFGSLVPSVGKFYTATVKYFTKLGKNSGDAFGTIVKWWNWAWGLILDYLAPVFVAIGEVIQAGITFATDIFTIGWDFIAGIVSDVFTFIHEVIVGTFGESVTSAGSIMETARGWFVTALHAISFAFKNWQLVGEIAFVAMELGLVTFANVVIHWFSTVIPDLLIWFADNWKNVFYTAFDYTTTILINLGQNIRDMFTAVWDYISSGGTSGFNFNFTPLTKGFKSAISEWPGIADREMGALEKDLQDRMGGLTSDLIDDWSDDQANHSLSAEALKAAKLKHDVKKDLPSVNAGLMPNQAEAGKGGSNTPLVFGSAAAFAAEQQGVEPVAKEQLKVAKESYEELRLLRQNVAEADRAERKKNSTKTVKI